MITKSNLASCCDLNSNYESPTWTPRRSRMHRSLTSSKGHRLESMRRWARMSFRSLSGWLPEAGADSGMGMMASTFLMTSWRMFSMASDLEMASRLPSPFHLPKDSWTSIFWCRTNVCAVLQQAMQQITHCLCISTKQNKMLCYTNGELCYLCQTAQQKLEPDISLREIYRISTCKPRNNKKLQNIKCQKCVFKLQLHWRSIFFNCKILIKAMCSYVA